MRIKFRNGMQEHLARSTIAILLVFVTILDYNGKDLMYFIVPSLPARQIVHVGMVILSCWLAFGKLYTAKNRI